MANTGRLNVLWLQCDQQPWDALSCYGNGQVLTPSIDRLASQGCRLTHCYIQSLEMRASVQSALAGAYPSRLSRQADRLPLPRILSDAGYRCLAIGPAWCEDDGFDTTDSCADQPVDGSEIPPTPNTASTAKAIEFLRAEPGKPFFCAITFQTRSDSAPEASLGLYDPGRLDPYHPKLLSPGRAIDAARLTHAYYAHLSEVDASCGKLLRELERLQLAESTIVVYGGLCGLQVDPATAIRGFIPQPALRVPLIFRGPADAVQAGVLCNTVAEALDVTPTLLEFLGLEVPPPVQGLSLRAALAGESRHHRDAAFTEVPDGAAIHTQHFQYTVRYDGTERFYDLTQVKDGPPDVADVMRYRGMLVEHRHRMITRLIQANYR